MTPAVAPPAGILRRGGALLYDGLLLAAVLFLGTLLLLPFTGGESITPAQSGPWAYVYRGWILLLAVAFFAVPWTRRGQTLGMMTWRIRLERDAGGLPGWREALLRLVFGFPLALSGLLGLIALARGGGDGLGAWGALLLLPALVNYLWMAIDPASRTLQDRLAGCRVLRVG